MSTLHYLRTGEKPVIQQLYAGRDENAVFFLTKCRAGEMGKAEGILNNIR